MPSPSTSLTSYYYQRKYDLLFHTKKKKKKATLLLQECKDFIIAKPHQAERWVASADLRTQSSGEDKGKGAIPGNRRGMEEGLVRQEEHQM